MTVAHRWEQIGEGLHAWIHPIGDWGWSNAGLIVGDGEAALVDTQWDERRTRDMLAIAPLPLDARPATLLLTHGDGDHIFGTGAVDADTIIASQATAAHMTSEDPVRFGRTAQLVSGIAALPVPAVLPGPLGRASELRRFARYMTRMTAPWAYTEARPTPPTTTFSGELDLEIGGRRVRLVDVGSAHSPGDTFVHVPDDEVVFAGDLLFIGVAPVMWIGPVTSWIAALDAIAALAPRVVVPGHGPVGGPDDLATLRDYWAWAIEIGERARAAGLSPARAAAEALLAPDHAALPWGGWRSPERLVISLTALEREAQGRGPIHSLVDRARVMAATAGVAEQLRDAGLPTTSFGPPAA